MRSRSPAAVLCCLPITPATWLLARSSACSEPCPCDIGSPPVGLGSLSSAMAELCRFGAFWAAVKGLPVGQQPHKKQTLQPPDRQRHWRRPHSKRERPTCLVRIQPRSPFPSLSPCATRLRTSFR